jgi:hypothetical protein
MHLPATKHRAHQARIPRNSRGGDGVSENATWRGGESGGKTAPLVGHREGSQDEFFYIECLGADTLSPLAEALTELAANGALVQVLGSYPKMSAPPQPGVVWEK